MKVAAIIAEYNPFHNGHAYLLQKARELTGADYCVAVMSGDFVQRGAPAIYGKYLRARMALLSGADLVLELPAVFSCGSAEDFAACGVALLDQLGVADALCFGSECGQTEPLAELAGLFCEEPEEYRRALTDGLKSGLSFPLARAKAAEHYLTGQTGHRESADAASSQAGPASPDDAGWGGRLPHVGSLLSSPNDILGIEYCKAIRRLNSSIRPVAVLRRGSGYHDSSLPEASSGFCPSAAALREILEDRGSGHVRQNFLRLSQGVPGPVLSLIRDAVPLQADDFSVLLSQRLLELQLHGRPLTGFYDVPGDLAARIRKKTLAFSSFTQRTAALKTRQYTYTRVSRALLHILLDITAEEAQSRKERGFVSHIRILGFQKSAAPLLSAIKKAARLPLITKTADAASILDPFALQMFNRDLYRSHLYQSVLAAKSGRPAANEYTASVLVLPEKR